MSENAPTPLEAAALAFYDYLIDGSKSKVSIPDDGFAPFAAAVDEYRGPEEPPKEGIWIRASALGCRDEKDCTHMPWCRINEKCHRREAACKAGD